MFTYFHLATTKTLFSLGIFSYSQTTLFNVYLKWQNYWESKLQSTCIYFDTTEMLSSRLGKL